MTHRTRAELEAALPHVTASPADHGTLELVIRRPAVGEREVLREAELTFAEGVGGDTWNIRGSKRTADGSSHPDMQLNVMNARFARFIAVDPDRMSLAGDQLYLDLDLSEANAPAGTRFAIGTAVIEVTDQPHTGCAKFTERFGLEALRFTNSPLGMSLKLRGVNARVVTEGIVRPGDRIAKVVTVSSSQTGPASTADR